MRGTRRAPVLSRPWSAGRMRRPARTAAHTFRDLVPRTAYSPLYPTDVSYWYVSPTVLDHSRSTDARVSPQPPRSCLIHKRSPRPDHQRSNSLQLCERVAPPVFVL